MRNDTAEDEIYKS